MPVTPLLIKHMRKLIEDLPDDTKISACLDLGSSASVVNLEEGVINTSLHAAIVVSVDGNYFSICLLNGVNTDDERDGIILPEVPQVQHVHMPSACEYDEEMTQAIANIYSSIQMEPILEP